MLGSCHTVNSGDRATFIYEGISNSAFRGHVEFRHRAVKSVSSQTANGLEMCPALRKSSTC